MPRTRVKICGISDPEAANAVVASGADAIGFNFYSGSSRYVDLEVAAEISASLPAFIASVALVVDELPDRVEEIIRACKPDLVQFHGAETPEFCRQFDYPYIKAIPVTDGRDLAERVSSYEDSRGVLLDTQTDGGFGGTGETFDWSLVPALSKPVILAGGLNAGNVRAAIDSLRPFAVDVSGGVEITKGQKDVNKIQEFCAAVRQADQETL